jgi:hypothetical protein
MMRIRLTRPHPLWWRPTVARIVALLLVSAGLATGPKQGWAQTSASATAPGEPASTGGASPAPAAMLPPSGETAASAVGASPSSALDLRPQSQMQTQPQAPLFRRWWFWTAVGVAAAATAAVIVISSRGHAPPATDLGNQEFQP